MKVEMKLFIAFILNLSFSIFEFVGSIFTGSVAIMSDAVHDIGDAASIGISYFLEKKSKQKADDNFTYGYARYSVIGSVVTTLILLIGSMIVIYNAVHNINNPAEINYDGMIVFAIIGVCVNFCAAVITHKGKSLNQKAVNLHMLEDVLGWIVVLLGAVIMRFTDIRIIDPIMSIGVALFIIVNAIQCLKEAFDVFLEKTPHGLNVNEIIAHISGVDGVLNAHHVHVWSMDGQNNYAAMHIVTNTEPSTVKAAVREKLKQIGIGHATLELETENEPCSVTQS